MNGGEYILCQECDAGFEVEQDYYGKTVTCPYCGESLKAETYAVI